MARMGYVQVALRVPVDLDNPGQVERAKESLVEDLSNQATLDNIIEGFKEAVELVESTELTEANIPSWLVEDVLEEVGE